MGGVDYNISIHREKYIFAADEALSLLERLLKWAHKHQSREKKTDILASLSVREVFQQVRSRLRFLLLLLLL